MIVCDADGKRIGLLNRMLGHLVDMDTFQLPAEPPFDFSMPPEKTPETTSYHLVTFENGKFKINGRNAHAVRVLDGVEHIDDVRGFQRETFE